MRSGEADLCWPWSGHRDDDGYGTIRYQNRQIKTHRLSWELTYGPIPGGLCVLHRCDNPPCCNPYHLFLGTNADNMADKTAKGRQSRGVRSGRTALTDDLVAKILDRLASGGSQREVAQEFGVSPGTIGSIEQGRTWVHVPRPAPSTRPRVAMGSKSGKAYGVSGPSIFAIRSGKSWGHLSGIKK